MTEASNNRFTKYFSPLLNALRSTDPVPMRPADARTWIRGHVQVPEEDMSRIVVNGRQTIFENDVHWARFYLAEAGLIASPRRGLWSLTPTGRDTHLTPETTWDLYVRVRDANRPGAADEDTAPAPEIDLADEEEPSYWFGGAVWDRTEDQTERFLAEGVWSNGYEDQFNDLVARMKPGDRIAIKASFVQKHRLPFHAGGKPVSCMRIKATGTVTGNKGDGKTVTVDWDSSFAPRDWYFYTYRTTLVQADTENEMALKLIEFSFNGASQDYEWWLKQPYWATKYSLRSPKLPAPASSRVADPDDLDTVRGGEAPTYTVDDIVADGGFVPVAELAEMLSRWRSKKNLILQGPPGTGKTFLAKRLGYALIGSRDPETARSRLRVVQFHPSLAYEDFVRGWRPKGKDGLELVDGIFMQAIEGARSEPDREFVLVIEEINRGNPAQIFGELLTLMEAGKRRREEAIELAYRRTDNERVFVPDNLYVIGTMNIADRSLALVDLALRRRFAFVDLEPRLGSQWRAWCEARGLGADVLELIAARIGELNAMIAAAPSLGPHFRIGHSYVTPDGDERVRDGRTWLRAKIETEIGPLLDEYWYDAPETSRQARTGLVVGL
ncbi:MAG: AAA family ATPase [Candidatus Rokubacteria bacterium]|nr:AAA family ATPase [Candidatus Rokubacteria bacterium]